MGTMRGLEVYTRIGLLRYTQELEEHVLNKSFAIRIYRGHYSQGIMFFLEDLSRWSL